VGKGVPASLTMASVRAALRSHATCGEERPIEHVMGVLNQHICRDTPTNEFVTLFYGVIDGSARRLRYCSAGHEPVLLLRNEEVCWLRAGGLVLGINPEATYAGDEASLEEGDVLVWYTDGLIDTMNYEGESYGRARLDESLRRHARLEPGQLANQLLWDVRRFAGLAKQTDDITIVVARVR
jgi:sigma-B regulation protein RsbU (phosphoserine phosphatase)